MSKFERLPPGITAEIDTVVGAFFASKPTDSGVRAGPDQSGARIPVLEHGPRSLANLLALVHRLLETPSDQPLLRLDRLNDVAVALGEYEAQPEPTCGYRYSYGRICGLSRAEHPPTARPQPVHRYVTEPSVVSGAAVARVVGL